MIICRTPYRISFFGGGTDYPSWYRENGGNVLAVTINRYCYLTCRYLPPFFEHKFRIVYSKTELCGDVDEIHHPAVRECLRFLNITRGVELHHDGDLPARSGMGSSSAFTVGLLHALHALKGDAVTKPTLAEEGIHIEQAILKENVGSQDQVLAAHGGFNHVQFRTDGQIQVRPLNFPAETLHELNAHLMLFYTGVPRTASVVAGSYVHTMRQKSSELRLMHDLVDESIELLSNSKSLSGFGELLHKSWMTKRQLSDAVSSSFVDEVYETGLAAGALGGKLLGAGGGGFVLLFVPPERQPAVRRALEKLILVPFQFEFAGSQIIFLDREGGDHA